MSSAAFGQAIKQADIDSNFLTSPGEDLVDKLLGQLSSVPGMVKFFGPYKKPTGKQTDQDQRWANYQRFDWSIRQLPAINVFEGQPESKQSDNAYVTGMISIQVFWPPNFRRSDLSRVPAAFNGVMKNFFASKLVADMLDEIYWHQRPMKVSGLNELGKVMNWTPNTEGIVESELVPVTVIDVNYRIDLRAWYRALEFMDRTKDKPFDVTLADLSVIGGDNGQGVYQGVNDNQGQDVEVEIPDEIKL